MNSSTSSLTLAGLLKKTADILKERGVPFALAGGVLADLYRGEPRATDDIDVLVAINEASVEKAEEIISLLGYKPSVATEAMLQGDVRFKRKTKHSTPQLVVGRDKKKPYGVDLMLLSFPWAANALERAECNLIDFPGVGRLPCLTVEDMVISKLFAIKNSSSRRYKKSDIPDVALMIENNSDIDLNYLSDSMKMLELILPKGVEQEAPPLIARVSRRIRKKSRSFDY